MSNSRPGGADTSRCAALHIRLVSRFIDARTLSLLDLEKVADLLDAKVVSGDFGLNASGSPCGTVTLASRHRTPSRIQTTRKRWHQACSRMRRSGMREFRIALRSIRATLAEADTTRDGCRPSGGNPARKNARCRQDPEMLPRQ
jgi:hypothetical protein